MGSNPNALAGTGPGIQMLTDEQARGLEKPKSREEVSCFSFLRGQKDASNATGM